MNAILRISVYLALVGIFLACFSVFVMMDMSWTAVEETVQVGNKLTTTSLPSKLTKEELQTTITINKQSNNPL